MPLDRDRLERTLRDVVPDDMGLRAFTATFIASVCQVVTLLVTWGLWHGRTDPPNLPLADGLASVNWGVPLLLLAVVAAFRPRLGGPAFCVVFVLSVLGDQMRIQPEVVSLALLMTLPAFGASGRAVARWVLATMWFWAGVNKALSLGWSTVGAGFVADALRLPDARVTIAVALPIVEIALGLSVLWPRAWRMTAVAGLVLHLSILLTLSPVLGDVNPSVWAWNLGLGLITFVLFWTRTREPLPATTRVQLAALALFGLPALFYGGAMDAYLAHNLYTGNTATAVLCTEDDGCATETFSTYDALNVAFPPEERLLRDAFLAQCSPGSYLDVTGIHTRLTGDPPVTRYRCEAG